MTSPSPSCMWRRRRSSRMGVASRMMSSLLGNQVDTVRGATSARSAISGMVAAAKPRSRVSSSAAWTIARLVRALLRSRKRPRQTSWRKSPTPTRSRSSTRPSPAALIPPEECELTILASGPGSARTALEPVFDALASRALWVGKAGMGSRLKLAGSSVAPCRSISSSSSRCLTGDRSAPHTPV